MNVAQTIKAAFDPFNSTSAIASFPADSIGAPGSAAFTSFAFEPWQGIPGGGDCVINPNNSSEQYTSATSGPLAIVNQTLDAWNDSVSIPLPQISGDTVPVVPPLAFDPINEILYMGTAFLNSLDDQTDTWTSQLGGTRLAASADSISAIAIAPTDPEVIYTGSKLGQVWMTQNQGFTWTRIDGGLLPLPAGVAITSISVNSDPNNPGAANDILVTDGTASVGHVFHCTDTTASGGVSWGDISANLPPASYYTIARDIDNPGSDYYVGCDFGMFYSLNSGTTWVNGTRSLGLPIVPVSELQAVSRPTCLLNASTLGRTVSGKIAFPAPTPTINSVSPNTGVVNGPDVSIQINGTGYFTGSTVFFNATPIPTNFEDSTDISATIPSNLLSTAGPDTITVVNPAPGNSSNPVTFTVTNPTPVITNLNPPGVVMGSAGITLSVIGSGFYSGSVVQWNGAALVTTFISATRSHYRCGAKKAT